MIRMLQVTRASAVRAKTVAITTMQDLLVTAPQPVRQHLAALSARRLVTACAALTVNETPTTPTESAHLALHRLARRYQQLAVEAADLETQIRRLTVAACPALLELHGVGPECAAALLIALGDNKHRIPATPRSPNSAASHRWRPPAGKPFATASTGAATGKPTRPCTPLSPSDSDVTNPPATTSNAASAKAKPNAKPSDV